MRFHFLNPSVLAKHNYCYCSYWHWWMIKTNFWFCFYSLTKIFSEGRLHHFLSCENESGSNWMRFVNYAPSPWQQNLAAYQIGMQIYFYAMKVLMPGEELLVGRSLEHKQPMSTSLRTACLKQPLPTHCEWQPHQCHAFVCHTPGMIWNVKNTKKMNAFILLVIYSLLFHGITASSFKLASFTKFDTFNFIARLWWSFIMRFCVILLP